MNIIQSKFRKEKEFSNLIETLKSQRRRDRKLPAFVTGLCEGALDCFLAALACEELNQNTILITASDEKDAVKINTSLNNYGYRSMFYPGRDPIFYDMISSHDVEYDRICILSKLLSNSLDFVVTTPDAALQYTIPSNILESHTSVLKTGDEINLIKLEEFLVSCGYVRSDIIDGKGQFSVRGGIVDIFSPVLTNPVRIEMFGDEIDSISYFDITTQRRREKLDKITLVPAREILMGENERNLLVKELEKHFKRVKEDNAIRLISSEMETLKSGLQPNFLDKYIRLIYPQEASLIDYFTSETLFIAVDIKECLDRLNSYAEHEKFELDELITSGETIGKYAGFIQGTESFDGFVMRNITVLTARFFSSVPYPQSGLFTFNTRDHLTYAGDYASLKEDMISYRKSGTDVLLLCGSRAEANAIKDAFDEFELKSKLYPDFGEIKNIEKGYIYISVMNLVGFELPLSKFACVSLSDHLQLRKKIMGKKPKNTSQAKNSKTKILSYTELNPGDFVVHDEFGICKFVCVTRMKNFENVTKDYIKLQFRDAGVMYIPCEHIDVISKYIGLGEDSNEKVQLSSLGTKEWSGRKAKVKAQVKDIAQDLIRLYAERMRKPGYAFPQDDEVQKEFESLFEYEETDAQLIASEEIKRDMEKPVPMDRLLCGDVGFGKTEVALRAAFKCILSGKQVALLAPTTILALQHYQTVIERMRSFPVSVEVLSRFTPAKEITRILRDLKYGSVDILIGTHRILSKDIQFRDLGLLIVDEEQRFGVTHKEKLKQLGGNIDVLTLTATPIPRTLNMAMNNIRDLSILDEAPVDRVPIQTYVLEYNQTIIEEAIRRELRRGGQVFYLYNRIETMPKVVTRLTNAFPNNRIAYAHGGLEKNKLNEIWESMVSGEIDILVCTTIIETGVDIPNANTLIIEDADRLGLSQLHQIRGRVGRSSRKAYTYFTYNKNKILNEDAIKRLEVIRDFTEFGAGFSIALKDLEIRGAGDLLGASQHGHMNSVGYNMYVRLLNEAVLEEQGIKPDIKTECVMNIARDSYIPNEYIRNENQRMQMYKKIGAIENEDDLSDIADEFVDRYGEMPNSVENLLHIALLKSLADKCLFTRIDQSGTEIKIFSDDFDFKGISELAVSYRYRINLVSAEKPFLKVRMNEGENVFYILEKVFNKYYGAVKDQKSTK